MAVLYMTPESSSPLSLSQPYPLRIYVKCLSLAWVSDARSVTDTPPAAGGLRVWHVSDTKVSGKFTRDTNEYSEQDCLAVLADVCMHSMQLPL